MHEFDMSIYVVCCHQQMTTHSSTRFDHCQTCHQTILLACQLKWLFSAATATNITRSSNDCSTIEYWNSWCAEFMYVH